jgi:hypothetical protein
MPDHASAAAGPHQATPRRAAAAARAATLAGCAALLLWAFLAPLARLAAPLPPMLLTGLAFALGGGLGLAVVAARRGGAGLAAALRQPPLAWAHGVGGLAGSTRCTSPRWRWPRRWRRTC